MQCAGFLASGLPVTLRRPRSPRFTTNACLIEDQQARKSRPRAAPPAPAPAPAPSVVPVPVPIPTPARTKPNVNGKPAPPPAPAYAQNGSANGVHNANGTPPPRQTRTNTQAPAPAALIPSRRRIAWEAPPKHVLLAVAPHSERAVRALPQLAEHLRETYGSSVYVEGKLLHATGGLAESVRKAPDGSVIEDVDLVICLGGDGLILHVVSTLFPDKCPPLMPFNMGSLGFLATFDFAQHKEHLATALQSAHIDIVARMRLRCLVVRAEARSCVLNYREEKMVEECGLQPDADYHVLNELVIDRGPAPYLSNLEVLCDDCAVTRVQADGLILATPTGSTAYNVSAGGSMVHPDVPAILFTPICPHSLSFRPVLFPVTATITIKVPDDARAGAWVCFDGRSRMELMRGDKVIVERSQWEVPTICKNDVTHDWFRSISKCLRWNERLTQGANDTILEENM